LDFSSFAILSVSFDGPRMKQLSRYSFGLYRWQVDSIVSSHLLTFWGADKA